MLSYYSAYCASAVMRDYLSVLTLKPARSFSTQTAFKAGASYNPVHAHILIYII